jgi:hypothetical protein
MAPSPFGHSESDVPRAKRQFDGQGFSDMSPGLICDVHAVLLV